MHRKKCVLGLFVFLLMLNIVYAQPPFQTGADSNDGLLIEVPIFEVVPISQNYSFYFHVFNTINGTYVHNDTADCYVHIYDFQTGEHILQVKASGNGNGLDFEVEINDSLLTLEGTYFKLIQCNTTSQAGFFGHQFKVGYALREATTPDAIINSLFILIAVIFFIVSLSFAFVLDGDDIFSMGAEGEHILEFNALKYVKLFLYLLSYFFFWITTWVIWITFEKFMLSSYSTDLLRILFIVETILWVPMIFMIVFIGLVKYIADAKALKLAKRRLMPR